MNDDSPSAVRLPATGSPVGRWARRIVRSLVRQYYSHIEITGAEQIPQSGPVLLCANHANSLFDPVLVGLAARRPVRFMAKAPLFDTPVLGPIMTALGMVPAFRGSDDARQVRRNFESLDTVAQLLIDGEATGIFPEGKSHDAARVETVRSGAARIAINAVEGGATDLQVVPIGINYERKEQFRSRVWIRVGEPIRVTDWLREHDGDTRKAMRTFTPELESRLKSLVIHLDEEEWESFLDDLQLLAPSAGRRNSGTRVGPIRQRKRITDAMNHFREVDRQRAEAVGDEIIAYRNNVAAARLRVGSPLLSLRGWRLMAELVWQRLWVLLLLIPAVVGLLVHIVPFTIVRWCAARIQTPGRTTRSQSLMLAGLPIYLGWYALVAWWVYGYFTSWFATVVLVLLPWTGLVALRYWHSTWLAAVLRWDGVRFLFQRDRLLKLRAQRSALCDQITALADEYAQAAPADPAQPARKPWGPVARRWAWRGVMAACLLLAYWFVGHWFAVRPSFDANSGLPLASIPAEQLDAQLRRDESSLRAILRGLDELESRATAVQADFAAGRRSYASDADNDAVRQLLLGYINYRTALVRLMWKYQRYGELQDQRLSDRSFLLGFAAASALYEASLKFVYQFNRSDETIARLNEGEPVWGIPSGMYDTVQRNLVNPANLELLDSARQYYAAIGERLESEELGTDSDYAAYHDAVADSAATVARIGKSDLPETTVVAAKDLVQQMDLIRYRTQSAISTWIGDFKIREPRDGGSLIEADDLQQLAELLQPGDILLERRNWYVSNAFLPGYWPHAAMYVGTVDDLRRMGLDEDPRVEAFWDEFATADAEHHPHVIVESVSEGVIFSSLEHSIGGADSAAVLRPQLSDEQIKEGIARAFSQVDKPYDFEFDFTSRDKLVCTEVVFRTYGANAGPIDFPLKRIMGRETMPAIELVRKYKTERSSPEAQLEFVAMLDGDESTGDVTFHDDAETFITTLDRPAFTFLQGLRHRPWRRIGPLGWSLLAVIGLFTIGNLIQFFRRDVDRSGPPSAVAEPTDV